MAEVATGETAPADAFAPSASPAHDMSAPELMRRLDRILMAAADKVGIAHGNGGYDIGEMAGAIVLAAAGQLPARDYRLVWGIYSIFKRHRGAP